ncbi:hypothetical protein [Marinobacterium aestuariivivens]|uniref:Uncharacterized protein n=1 Tax=Marinobacterium aestuariivivens TaxID=1698799 RepID=A0ABW1ZZX2_9GAMM
MEAELGQDTGYSISAQLDDSGRFYQRVTLSANGDRHPGKGTELSIAGHIDPDKGVARGTVMVTPGRYSVGCLGDFVAYSDDGRSGLSSNIVPFSTEYHFTEFRDHK